MAAPFDVMDDATAALILELQLEDAGELARQAGGAQPNGKVTDSEMALRLHQEELRQSGGELQIALRGTAEPVRTAEDVSELVTTLRQIRLEELRHNDSITRDHEVAEAYARRDAENMLPAGMDGHNADDSDTDTEQGEDDDSDQKDSEHQDDAEYRDGEEAQTDLQDQQEAVAVEDVPQPSIPCSTCMDNFFDEDLATAPCEHRNCRDCLRQIFTRAFVDEELFPPRCCRQTIPLESVTVFLTPEIEVTFAVKTVEYGTKHRVYCSAPGCETFLTPDMVIREGVSQCANCQAVTCLLCKNAIHDGDCPIDEAMAQLELLAEGEGWTRCPECRRMVDLISGCYHMSCACHTQFCYLCAAFPWKACECPQWDEDRLMERAAEVLLVQNRANRIAGPPALNAVLEVAEDLAGRHNCEHVRFVSQRGRNACHMCGDTMPQFIYSCLNCHILLCRRCKRNRL